MLLKVQSDGDGRETLRKMQVSHFPEMSLFLTDLVFPGNESGKVVVTYRPPGAADGDPRITSLEIPLQPEVRDLKKFDIVLHRSPTEGYDMGGYFNDWFSECFGYRVVLAYLGGNSRKVLGSFSPRSSWVDCVKPYIRSLLMVSSIFSPAVRSFVSGDMTDALVYCVAASVPILVLLGIIAWRKPKDEDQITFADCAAYLVVSETSLHNVSDRLTDGEMDITKFRPNIVVSGAETAFEEDFWAELALGEKHLRLFLTANCARCLSLNVDFVTGRMGTGDSGNVLKKLMKDRRVDEGAKYSPIFGRYGFLGPSSERESIRVGDEVILKRKNSERTVYGESTGRINGCY